MSTFLGQLVGFAVIVFLLWRYVVPPVRKGVANQKNAIAQQAKESEEAAARVADAQAARERAREEAKVEATELHKGALADADSIREDLRAQADSEVKRISEHGTAQVALSRANLVRQLRSDLGLTAVDGADKIVRQHLSDDDARAKSVDRVITDLESMADGSATESSVPGSGDLIGLHSLRADSRDAAREVSKAFDDAAQGSDGAALDTAAEELTEVVVFFNQNPVLRKRIAEPTDAADAKRAFVERLFGGKISAPALAAVGAAAAARWSSSGDFTTALQRQGQLAVLAAAERDDQIEEVEDELFRVSRLLESNPELALLIGDDSRPADGRVGLLSSVVGNQVGAHTTTLLSQTVRLLHGQPSDVAVDQLAQLAAARRGEKVAHVVAASELSGEQSTRLAGVLGRIYGRTMSIQTEVDPDVLGGLRIAVGDEVIEADIASRLAKASETLPR